MSLFQTVLNTSCIMQLYNQKTVPSKTKYVYEKMPEYFRILTECIMEQNTDNFTRYSKFPFIRCPQDWTGATLSDSTKILQPALRECAHVRCFHFIMKKKIKPLSIITGLVTCSLECTAVNHLMQHLVQLHKFMWFSQLGRHFTLSL